MFSILLISTTQRLERGRPQRSVNLEVDWQQRRLGIWRSLQVAQQIATVSQRTPLISSTQAHGPGVPQPSVRHAMILPPQLQATSSCGIHMTPQT